MAVLCESRVTIGNLAQDIMGDHAEETGNVMSPNDALKAVLDGWLAAVSGEVTELKEALDLDEG